MYVCKWLGVVACACVWFQQAGLRQENDSKLEASLGYVGSSRPTWTTWQNPISESKQQQSFILLDSLHSETCRKINLVSVWTPWSYSSRHILTTTLSPLSTPLSLDYPAQFILPFLFWIFETGPYFLSQIGFTWRLLLTLKCWRCKHMLPCLDVFIYSS